MLMLGKKPPKKNLRTLFLPKYTAGMLPAPPEKRAWEYVIADDAWGMLGNDTLGLCVEAAVLHYIMAATANTKKPATFTTQQCIDLYSAVTGYDPAQVQPDGSNPTDNGTAWTDMLAYWQKNGVYGHFILGWASIPFSDLNAIRQGIDIFGGVLIGTAVTQSMEDQFNSGQPWNAPFDGGVLGGHGIPAFGFGSEGETVVTWGARQPADLTLPSQFDECYVVVTQDFMENGVAPNGFNLNALTADLKLIAA